MARSLQRPPHASPSAYRPPPVRCDGGECGGNWPESRPRVLAHGRWRQAHDPLRSRRQRRSAATGSADLGSRRHTMLDRNSMRDLIARARRAGLAPNWIDASGRRQTVSLDTLRTVLIALAGFDAGDDSPQADARCFSIEEVMAGRRATALAVQLYSLRGTDGFGDLGALATLARAVAPLGVDAIAVSPIHAPFLTVAADISPYAPSSRLFLNPLYAAVDVPDDGKDGLVDWPEASRAKLARLHNQLTVEEANTDARLRNHARFVVLVVFFCLFGLWCWQDWPGAYRD